MSALENVVIVSGGSKGIGLGIVEHLLAQSYIVATFSRNKQPIIEELEKSKYKANFYWEAIDVANFNSLLCFVKNVQKKFGKIDCLINNAGIAAENIVTMMPSEVTSQLISVNLESAIRLTQICVKNMLIRRSGCIVNISSINAIKGHAGVSIYSATKAALDGFTRSLSKELGPRGIRVNSIAPGYLQTDMTSSMTGKKLQQILRRTPLGRLGLVTDVVGVVDFLLSPAANFITGQTLVVDGGLTC